MTIVKLAAALQFASQNGQDVKKKDLAGLLWPKSAPTTQAVNISNMLNGTTIRVDTQQVHTICTATGVDANFLFGIEAMDEEKKKEFDQQQNKN